MRTVYALLPVLVIATSAQADPFTVDSTLDDDVGDTLRVGVAATNGDPDDDTIDFDLAQQASITLDPGKGTLLVTDDLLVDGATATDLVISGDGSFPLFTNEAPDLTLRDVDLVDGGLVTGDGAGDMLTIERSADSATISGVISGTGGLAKAGAGTVVLEGENTYTGGTVISGGTLEGTVTSVPGDVAVAQDAALRLEVADGGPDTFSGVVSGAGGFEKTGNGTLVLDAPNTYTGGTTITAGTLEGTVDSVPGNVSTTSDGTLSLDSVGTDTFPGDVTGEGSLTKTGVGTLVLTGNTGYTGTTTIDEGTIELDQSVDNALSGVITGPGTLVKNGTGRLTLTGANDYSGGTTVLNGTLQGDASSLQGGIQIEADGGVTFDQGTPGEYAGVLGGTGTVEKLGMETLGMSGDSAAFGGTTTVSAGRLDVTGILGGSIGVSSGATLGGTGQVGALASSGTVAPGLSIGTLQVTGDATFASGSILEIEVDGDAMQADLLEVVGGGSAIFEAGSLLRALPMGGFDAPLSRTVVTAGSVTGLPSLAEDLTFLDVSLMLVGGTALELTIAADPDATFEAIAETPNQTAIAQVLDAELSAGATDLAILEQRFALTETETRAALDDMAGETATAFTTPQLAAQSRLFRSIETRVRGFVAGAPPRTVPQTPGGTLPQVGAPPGRAVGPAGNGGEAPSPLGAWLDGYGVFGDLSGGSAHGVDYGVYGTSLGLDHALTEEILVGGAFGYARIDAELDGRGGDSAQANVFQGALYGAWAAGRFHAAASGRFAYDDFQTRRRIQFADVDATAKADFDGFEAGAHLEAGALAFSGGGFRVEPLASFDFAHLDYEGYNESGAGTSSLRVASRDVTSLVTGLGARVHGVIEMEDEGWMTPELRLRWTHEFGDTERKVRARLNGGLTGATFQVEGAEVGRDGLAAGIGYVVTMRPGLHFGAGYDLWWNPDALQHTATIGVHLSF